MNPLTVEWIEKAEGDWNCAWRERRARKVPNYDAACFHAQQCAEKYLKACLHYHAIEFGRTHNLRALASQLIPLDPTWEPLFEDLRSLTHYAVDFRYPGQHATKVLAIKAIQIAGAVRDKARVFLELPT